MDFNAGTVSRDVIPGPIVREKIVPAMVVRRPVWVESPVIAMCRVVVVYLHPQIGNHEKKKKKPKYSIRGCLKATDVPRNITEKRINKKAKSEQAVLSIPLPVVVRSGTATPAPAAASSTSTTAATTPLSAGFAFVGGRWSHESKIHSDSLLEQFGPVQGFDGVFGFGEGGVFDQCVALVYVSMICTFFHPLTIFLFSSSSVIPDTE